MRPVALTPYSAPVVRATGVLGLDGDVGRDAGPDASSGDAATRLACAREHERAGQWDDAVREYAAAAAAAVTEGALPVRAEALRRQGAVMRRRHELDAAMTLSRRSYDTAAAANDPLLTAEALNAIALVHVERGEWHEARTHLEHATVLGAVHDELRGRIEQNFGVIANIEGDLREALLRYQRSLEAFRAAKNERGCAIAYHNLGMISADRRSWAEADQYFAASLDVAETTGDVHLRGCVLLNWTEVHIARQRYEDARRSADEALRIFDQLNDGAGKSDAYKFLGVLYRETGATALAEARLGVALTLATQVGATLQEAEATRELALVYRRLDRNEDALGLLNRSHVLFHRLGARADVLDVTTKVANLESLFLEVVAQWGRSLESADTYTYGHSERVADYAAAIAAALNLDDNAKMTIRMGAFLHDLGKVRVPHEILNKPGKLTTEEFDVIKMHPLWGLELVEGIEFPWAVRPIIRSHHEKLDGTGYPDGLRGDEISLHANIVCAADVFDAMTTTRSYKAAAPAGVAIMRMHDCKGWWRPDVFEAFLGSVGRGYPVAAAA